MKTKFLKLALASTVLFFASCSDDDNPTPVNEEEVITTLTVTLVPPLGSGSTAVTLQTQDLDGEGPNPPVISVSGDLDASTSYLGTIELLNELENPAEDITEEIEEEDDEHQFFFEATNSIATTSYSDADDNGNPIGLSFELTTGSAGSGNFTVTLRHEPNKDAAGVSDGDITNAGGSTDIAVTFPITVQ